MFIRPFRFLLKWIFQCTFVYFQYIFQYTFSPWLGSDTVILGILKCCKGLLCLFHFKANTAPFPYLYGFSTVSLLLHITTESTAMLNFIHLNSKANM